jgi:hypothetical protein
MGLSIPTEIASLSVPSVRPAEHASHRKLAVPIGGQGWGWSLLARYGLIFSLRYFLLAVPLSFLPAWYGRIDSMLEGAFYKVVPRFADYTAAANLYQWTIPLVIAVLWLLMDRKRKHEVMIHEAGRLFARYGLAMMMSSYGLEKVFGGQGAWAYEPRWLLTPYGDQSRGMGLMTWLAHSGLYEQFAGWVEVSATLLLPFRRTATLGALMGLAALVNVFVVNTGHWNLALSLTPVYFGAMPLFLLAPQARRVIQLFRGRAVDPIILGYINPPRWWWAPAGLVKACVVGWILYSTNHFFFAAEEHVWHSPLGGLYRVESFIRNGKTEPLGSEYPARWREVTIGRYGEEVSLETVDGTNVLLSLEVPQFEAEGRNFGVFARTNGREQARRTSAPEGTLVIIGSPTLRRPFTGNNGTETLKQFKGGKLHFQRSGDQVCLTGIAAGDTIDARLIRVDEEALPFFRYRWYPSEWRRVIASWARSHGVVYPY